MSGSNVSGGNRIRTLEEFLNVHAILLEASGIPQALHRLLFEKLSNETFDGGDFFQIEPVEKFEGRQRRLVFTSELMRKESNVFLVDHAWTFRLSDAYKQLLEVPGLSERMASLMCVDIDSDEAEVEDSSSPNTGAGLVETKPSAAEILEREISLRGSSDSVRWLELEELDLDDSMLSSLDLPGKFPNLLALSLCSNKLENVEAVAKQITQLKQLRALWIMDNPLLEKGENCLVETIFLQGCPRLEIYNSCFTSNYGRWALGFCGGLYDKENPGSGCDDIDSSDLSLRDFTSLDLSNRCIHSLISKAFTPAELPCLSYLNLHGNPLDENSIDDLLELLRGFSSFQSLEVDIPGPLGDSAVEILESLPMLSLLNGVNASKIMESGKSVVDSMLQPRLPEWTTDEPVVDRVINAMWLYLMTYRLADDEKIDETSVWYVMDELGSALRHSDAPNFRVSPFLYMPEGNLASAISYSILWPVDNIERGDECTRDFLFGIGEQKQRSARLTAWFQTPKNYFIKEYEKHSVKLQQQSKKLHSPPPLVPSLATTQIQSSSNGGALRVYTDIPQVEEFLTRPEFVITSDPKNADIIWTHTQVDEELKKAVGLNDEQLINQFPFEACLVMKHHLAETVEKAYGAPEWIQPTYNLETQLTQLIGDYCVRERDKVNNIWILKPWNMARTIDTTVTEKLSAIIRLMETGPKICQKYIENPALFMGKKFDLRYIVLVRSINPLEIFLADTFWVRLANNPYSLVENSFFDYETHFTVMMYRGRLNHMNTSDFVKEFEKEHHVDWLDIHSRVKRMIRSVFEAARMVHPEMHSSTSRAMYGVDVMLDSHFQPKLLEVTYCPDCTRACKYDTEPVIRGGGGTVKGVDFFNYVFGCLFLNETDHVSPL